MGFEGSSEESLEHKDLARSFQGMYDSQFRMTMPRSMVNHNKRHDRQVDTRTRQWQCIAMVMVGSRHYNSVTAMLLQLEVFQYDSPAD